MKVIILSAGQGRRLLPLTAEVPKCAVPVSGRTMLEWQLREISRCPVSEVVVVTGFGAPAVEALVARTRGLKVRTLHNPFYALSDNLGTCWVARSEMDEPFVLINGDTLFEAAVLNRLLTAPAPAPITLAVDAKSTYDADDMKIVSHADRLLKVGKQLDPGEVNGESIGMMSFTDAGALLFRKTVERLMARPDGLKRWYLSAIDELARERHVGVCSIHGLEWCEIDDHADLAAAETLVEGWRQAPERGFVVRGGAA